MQHPAISDAEERCSLIYAYDTLKMPVSHFVNFSRAAVEHANDPDVIIADSNPNPPARGNEWMTYEEVDVELTNGWKDFMTLWFDYCLRQNYFEMFHFSAL